MSSDSSTSTTYYVCPNCQKEQIVYLIPKIIEDNGNYRFTTSCSDCETDLSVKIGFDLTTSIVSED